MGGGARAVATAHTARDCGAIAWIILYSRDQMGMECFAYGFWGQEEESRRTGSESGRRRTHVKSDVDNSEYCCLVDILSFVGPGRFVLNLNRYHFKLVEKLNGTF